ncbi:MAG: glycosyltransferase family 39 protein [bacterium]|nr:glycosyltransferase family 39 protein [bacterium]
MWVLILSFCHFLGIDMVPASKFLGILFHLLSGGLMFLLVRKLLFLKDSVTTFTAAILSGGLILNYRLVAHSVSGMETSLYLFSIMLLVYLTTCALRESSSSQRWWLILSLMTAGLFLVRPEGIAAGGLSLLALAVARKRDLLKPKVWGILFGGLLLPIALFIGLKLLIFGYALPHSYYHKLIETRSEYGAAFRHLALFVKSYWWLAAISGLSALYAVIKQKKYHYIYYGFFFFFMVAVYLFFYPTMNYLHRFYIPYLPLLLVMLAPALDTAARRLNRSNPEPFRLPLLLFPLFALLVVGLNTQLNATQKVITGWSQMVNPQIYRAKLGRIMNQLPELTIVANSEMGVIPYYSRLECIDMAGLTDPHISHNGLTMEYLEKREVDLILFPRDVEKLTAAQWNEFTLNYKNVFLSPRFKEDFLYIGAYAAWPNGSNKYYLYADRTGPRFKEIQQWRDTYSSEIKK